MIRQKGFTLIELMVVIVIIGILSALAIPKMFGVSAKAKAAEVPTAIASWETLQAAHVQETGSAGAYAVIGFKDPSPDSKWFTYTDGGDATAATITATPNVAFGDCAATDNFVSTFTAATNAAVHTHAGTCATSYTPNF